MPLVPEIPDLGENSVCPITVPSQPSREIRVKIGEQVLKVDLLSNHDVEGLVNLIVGHLVEIRQLLLGLSESVGNLGEQPNHE